MKDNYYWNFYNCSNDSIYLKKALQWAAKANDFFKSPEVMDTYARLLYKTGNKDEAVNWMSKAIQLKKERGFKTDSYETALANMKEAKAIK